MALAPAPRGMHVASGGKCARLTVALHHHGSLHHHCLPRVSTFRVSSALVSLASRSRAAAHLASAFHSTICQPDDSHTFGRTFGGRPAREATDRRASHHGGKNSNCRRYVQNEGDISRWCGRITARDQPGTPDILVIFPLVSIHNSP